MTEGVSTLGLPPVTGGGGTPSTHVLNPAVERFAQVVFNEAFRMRLTAATGLSVAKSEIRRVEGVEYLLVDRYDRASRRGREGATLLDRLHQEDFCQALRLCDHPGLPAHRGELSVMA